MNTSFMCVSSVDLRDILYHTIYRHRVELCVFLACYNLFQLTIRNNILTELIKWWKLKSYLTSWLMCENSWIHTFDIEPSAPCMEQRLCTTLNLMRLVEKHKRATKYRWIRIIQPMRVLLRSKLPRMCKKELSYMYGSQK